MCSCRRPPCARRSETRHHYRPGGKTYRLLMGDAHRHRYPRPQRCGWLRARHLSLGMDAAPLDWLGTSDHKEVASNWPDGLREYQWWTVQKTVDLMMHPPVFIGVYS